jgi:hypothetical protein
MELRSNNEVSKFALGKNALTREALIPRAFIKG